MSIRAFICIANDRSTRIKKTRVTKRINTFIGTSAGAVQTGMRGKLQIFPLCANIETVRSNGKRSVVSSRRPCPSSSVTVRVCVYRRFCRRASTCLLFRERRVTVTTRKGRFASLVLCGETRVYVYRLLQKIFLYTIADGFAAVVVDDFCIPVPFSLGQPNATRK